MSRPRPGLPVAGWGSARLVPLIVADVELNVDVPHAARIYDYLLGGKDNFAADRAAAASIVEAAPSMPVSMRINRQYMVRAARYLAEERGIRQFLDIGTGIPTSPNLHEVVQKVAPESRVVYVDNDQSKPGCAHGTARCTSWSDV